MFWLFLQTKVNPDLKDVRATDGESQQEQATLAIFTTFLYTLAPVMVIFTPQMAQRFSTSASLFRSIYLCSEGRTTET